jgi:hypothetical protein
MWCRYIHVYRSQESKTRSNSSKTSHNTGTEGQQCQNPELATSLIQSRMSRLDGRATADFGHGSATSLNVGFDTYYLVLDIASTYVLKFFAVSWRCMYYCPRFNRFERKYLQRTEAHRGADVPRWSIINFSVLRAVFPSLFSTSTPLSRSTPTTDYYRISHSNCWQPVFRESGARAKAKSNTKIKTEMLHTSCIGVASLDFFEALVDLNM